MEPTTTVKEQKEAFVTGHSGTSIQEILLICASSPVGVFFYMQLVSHFFDPRVYARSKKQSWKVCSVVEFVVVLLPTILCQTKFLYPVGVSVLLVELTTAVLFLRRRYTNAGNDRRLFSNDAEGSNTASIPKHQQRSSMQLPFLSLYRSSIYFLTFVAILAVDFRIFPRTLAKTETTGYGFMDLGASSFVISSGFVSARKAGTLVRTSRRWSLWTILPKSVWPLLGLGLLRLVTNKGIQYQEHVSEYGVHWNFFFTLAVVQTLSFWVIQCNPARKWPITVRFLVPWVVMGLYQVLLSVFSLQDYIEEGSRTTCPVRLSMRPSSGESTSATWMTLALCRFFAANREGVLGCIGYQCLHFISQDIASYCLWWREGIHLKDETSSERKFHMTERQTGVRLAMCSAVLWTLHFICVRGFGITVSRRSTNITFMAWSLAHNVTILFSLWLVCYVCGRAQATTCKIDGREGNKKAAMNCYAPKLQLPSILLAVNHHGLVMFVLANLLTGVVNLSMNTLKIEEWLALIVLIGYCSCIALVAIALDRDFVIHF